MSSAATTFGQRGFALAWLFLCLVLALHLWDQAAHDFLSYYNATALTLYGYLSWLPRMDLTRHQWLASWIAVILALFAVTPFAARNARWLRAFAYLLSVLLFLDALGYVVAQILGGTVPSVRFDGIAPGFYTAMLFFPTAGYLFWHLRRTRATLHVD